MFWAMMYLLFFGGAGNPCGLHVPDAGTFKKAVKDPDRLEIVLELREQAEEVEDRREAAMQRALRELTAMNPHHTIEPESIQAVLTQIDEARRAARDGLLDTRFALRDQLTRDEWKKIYGAPQ